jgi:hypothetical protein
MYDRIISFELMKKVKMNWMINKYEKDDDIWTDVENDEEELDDYPKMI